MAPKTKTTPYRCDFCRERLNAVKIGGQDILRCCLLIRPYQCPHCFTTFFRPFAWIGRLPLIGRLFQIAGNAKPAAQPGVFPTRDGDIGGPVTRRVANFGRWVTRVEKSIARSLGKFLGGIWSVIWFFPGKLLGTKKKRGRSKSKFLKPQR